jgi:hypothetical protein
MGNTKPRAALRSALGYHITPYGAKKRIAMWPTDLGWAGLSHDALMGLRRACCAWVTFAQPILRVFYCQSRVFFDIVSQHMQTRFYIAVLIASIVGSSDTVAGPSQLAVRLNAK